MKVTISLFFVIVTTVTTNAQLGYTEFPLDIGNVWVHYLYSYSGGFDTYYISNETITIDTLQYNLLYYRNTGLHTYVRLREDGYYVRRKDSSYNEPNNEQIYYKKNAKVGDGWTQLMYGGDTITYTSVVTDTFPAYIFDTVVVGKNVYIDLGLNIFNQVWTEEFGLLYTEDFYGPKSYLAGCIIRGKLYGDTSTTSVEYEYVSYLPDQIELSQNYPNPFNPSTNIEYILPGESYVNLILYNSLGEEVTVLVDEFQRSGKYKVHFSTDELRGLPGGVYFYSLKTENNIVTKKMVLIH